MRKIWFPGLLVMLSLCCFELPAEERLTARQQAIIPIAAFTANGDLEKLKISLNAGLDAGLTVNEIREILVQMYACCGFPRSLNGLNSFPAVLEGRRAKGVNDPVGPEAGPLPAEKSVREPGAAIQTKLVGHPVPAQAVTRAETVKSVPASAKFFTGKVSLTRLWPPNETASFSGAYVTFEPGARSYWHTHPTGQHLIVVDGVGRTGEWNGPVHEICQGDVIWCPPGVRHWHGAAPDSAMTHMAISGTGSGGSVTWLEAVSDEQYNQPVQ